MKICFIFWRNGVGGLESINRLYYNYYIQNKDKGVEPFVFILKPNGYQGFFSAVDPFVEYGADATFPAIIKLFYFLKKRKFDILHLSNSGVYILFLTSFFSSRIIYHIHGTKHFKSNFRKPLEKILWWCLVKTKNLLFVANSKTSKDVFKNNIPGQPELKLIYNTIDITKFRFKSRKNKSVQTLFYMGRFSKGKNLLLWLDIADTLYQQKGILSYLYGDGAERPNLEAHINKHCYQGTQLMGFTNNPVEVYHKHDLMLFLSLHESFGNVVIECLLCGTPVLTLNIPAMKELLQPFPCFLIDSNQDILEQVQETMMDIDKLRKEAEKASVYFSNLFSMERHLEQFLKIYQKNNIDD